MKRNNAYLLAGLLAIVQFLCLIGPSLLVSEGLIFWADKIMGSEVDSLSFLCAFGLGLVIMFTVGFRFQDYFARRTECLLKRVRDALRESED